MIEKINTRSSIVNQESIKSNSRTLNCQDIMLYLCDSVSSVLSEATARKIHYTPMIQRINETALRPDIGTFVLFTGSFSGMVVINFPKEAAMEIYSTYMKAMTIPENEIATNYTSEEVAGTLGELMNQILGNFTRGMSTTLHSRIQQSQPKMLTLPHEVKISINMALDKPKVNRVTFLTQDNNVFYVEFAMDDTEFTVMEGENESEEASPDDILESVLGNL